MKKNLPLLLVMLLLGAATSFAQTTFELVTSASELEVGKNYIIVSEMDGSYYAMGRQNTTTNAANRPAVAVVENDGRVTVEIAMDASDSKAFQFELGGSANAWTFYDAVNGGYLYAAASDKNKLGTQETLDDNGKWSITFLANGLDSIVAQGTNTRNTMRFNPNNGTPIFSCYSGTSNINTNVSLYKETSDVDVMPEPSNHVTDFTATVVMTDIILNWTDATGDQIPTAYLIKGVANGTVTDPVDGTPEANYIDDQTFIANVPAGVQEYEFLSLEIDVNYTFKIYPYTNTGNIIDYKTDGVVPSVTRAITNIAILLDEPFDEDLGVFTAYNVSGEQVWAHNEHNDDNFAQMSGYDGSNSNENEDWLISPAINGDTPKVYLEFRTAKNYSGNPLALKISTDYNETAGPEAATWTDITELFQWSNGGFNWVESGTTEITSYVDGNNFHIAFVYTSTDENSSTWEIDYVRVIAADLDNVEETAGATFSVYPNPASQQVSLVAEANTVAVVYDAAGRKVMEVNVTKGENSINVQNLENGVYFIMMDSAVSKFLKY